MEVAPEQPKKHTLAKVLILLFAAFQLSGICFVLGFFLFWPGHRTGTFRKAQADKPVSCDIEVSYESETRRTIREPGWIQELDRAFSGAEYFGPDHPHREKEFYLRVTRASSKVDQYIVFLDTRGGDYDYFSVVNRSGKRTTTGSSFRAPGLRRLMEQSGVK